MSHRVTSRLRAANWLASRLPFAWAPRWLNNALARWMLEQLAERKAIQSEATS